MEHLTNARIFLLICILSTFSLLAMRVIYKLDVPIKHFRNQTKTTQMEEIRQIMHFKVSDRETASLRCSNNNHTCAPQTVATNKAAVAATAAGIDTAAAPATTAPMVGRGDVLQETFSDEQRFVTIVEKHLKEFPSDSKYRNAVERVVRRAKMREPGWRRNEKQSILDSQFIHYMKCPTSLHQRILSEPYARHKFVPETPILAWNDHFSKEEFARLSNYHGIFGWKDMNETDVASALAALNSSHNRYMFDDRIVNGDIPRKTDCIRCAVVGNGGILKGSKKGKEIDANDYVFRVNTALTKGYEKDVGTRTSFYCFGIITLANTQATGLITGFHQLPNDMGVRYVFFGDNEWVYRFLTAALNRQPLPRSKDNSWVNSTFQHLSAHRPTTGGIMLLLALHTCDEVNAYGFAGSYTKYSDHYYDKTFMKHKLFLNHDNFAEDRLWKELHMRRIINLYMRD